VNQWGLPKRPTAPFCPSEVQGSIAIPQAGPIWPRILAFVGPGFLVAVGYMDPGNWATDIAGGAQFGYALLSVIFISNLIAVLLQSLCVRLGIGTGQDLAQMCRSNFSRPVSFLLWIFAEIAIIACDLAELLGSALALKLLFQLPLVWGVCITALDIFVVLLLQDRGFRLLELLIFGLILLIGSCFLTEILLAQTLDYTSIGHCACPNWHHPLWGTEYRANASTQPSSPRPPTSLRCLSSDSLYGES
jgi:manganese transport protein